MPRFPITLDKFPYYDIKADTSDDGTRVYHTPVGDAPSVTTILSSLPNPELDAWRERMGLEEAERISKEATTLGSYMHDMLEAHLRGLEFQRDGTDLETTAVEMAKAVRMFGWQKLNAVWGVEVPLHFNDLYAGRTDLIGVYDKKPSILDYKTSKYFKPPTHLVKYKLQLSLYAMALEKMFGQKIDQGVLFFSIRPNPERNQPAQSNTVVIGSAEFFQVKLDAIQVLIDYWSVRDESKLDSIEELMKMVGA
jgi:CRISPR/Cas system-associated exonuclease Cas4 (RecB family)